TVTERGLVLALDDSANRAACRGQVVGMHIVGNKGADQLVGAIAKQRLAGVADKDNAIIRIDHENGVEQQTDQFGVERLEINGHQGSIPVRSPGSIALFWRQYAVTRRRRAPG